MVPRARLVDSAAFSEGSLTGDSAIFVRPSCVGLSGASFSGSDRPGARIREAKICCCLHLRAAA
jgi:hypothetical protein